MENIFFDYVKKIKKSLAMKYVRRDISQNVKVRVQRGYLKPGCPVTVRLIRDHLTPKMNITFFITN